MGKPTRSELSKIQPSPKSAGVKTEPLSSVPACTVGCTGLRAGTGLGGEHIPLLRNFPFLPTLTAVGDIQIRWSQLFFFPQTHAQLFYRFWGYFSQNE